MIFYNKYLTRFLSYSMYTVSKLGSSKFKRSDLLEANKLGLLNTTYIKMDELYNLIQEDELHGHHKFDSLLFKTDQFITREWSKFYLSRRDSYKRVYSKGTIINAFIKEEGKLIKGVVEDIEFNGMWWGIQCSI